MSGFTPEQVYAVLQQLREKDQASIYEGATEKPQDIQEIILDLDEERPETNPYVINAPFKNLYVETSTGVSDVAYLKPNAVETYQAAFKLEVNSAVEFETPVSKAYLHWKKQPGAKMVLKISIYSKFKSGKLLSLNAGGMSISEGAIAATLPNVTVTSAVTMILDTDTSRKVALIENKSTRDLFIGDASVDVQTGITLAPGEIFKFMNTAKLYAIAKNLEAGNVAILVER